MRLYSKLKFGVIVCLFQFSDISRAETQEIIVAVAANVQYAFEEIRAEFLKDKKILIKSVLGSSAKLTAQIKNGAPFDIFISADTEYPESICKDHLCAFPAKIYAKGYLVLWTMNNLDLNKGMSILNDVSIKKIALANPKTAPYGREAINALTTLKLNTSLESKLVYGESIAQASQYIATKSADIGFTAKSIVLSADMLNKGKWIEVPTNLYTPIAQAAVLLKGKNEKTAQEFYAYLYTEKIKKILTKYGYIIP